jgi:hypothetical protein
MKTPTTALPASPSQILSQLSRPVQLWLLVLLVVLAATAVGLGIYSATITYSDLPQGPPVVLRTATTIA